MPIATLIAAERLESGIISDACDRLVEAGLDVAEVEWIDSGIAADIGFSGAVDVARIALAPLEEQVDIAVQSGEARRKMLLVSDMDSTMITVECIDELADYAGIKPQIAAITERAMQGELDFVQALRARVGLLKNLDEEDITTCLEMRVKPMPGGKALVKTMAGWGAHTILVSGGFTAFADSVASQLGFAEYYANVLGVSKAKLTGTVEGGIVDAAAKRALLEAAAASHHIDPAAILAVGDGANDLPMIEAAMAGEGLGVAYRAKPVVAVAANFAVRHGDLTALLYAQGVKRADWAI